MSQTESISKISNAIELCNNVMHLIDRCRQTGSTTAITSIENARIVVADRHQAIMLRQQNPGLNCIAMNAIQDVVRGTRPSKLVFDNYAVHKFAEICCQALHESKHTTLDGMLYENLASVADYLQALATANWLTRLKWLIFGFRIPKHIEDIFNSIARELYDDTYWD